MSELNRSVPGDVQVESLHDHLQYSRDFSVVLALKLVRTLESIDLAESQHSLGGGCYRPVKNWGLY